MVTIDHARGNQVSLRWLLYDGHGNLVRTMAPDYALSGWQWRGVWGERTTSTAGRGYCANLGHPEDETGLIYMRARYYEPATGRFISEDPARDGVNWYLYADGNPVAKVDFEGRMSAAAKAFWGNLFVLIGLLCMGAGIYHLEEVYVKMKLEFQSYLEEEFGKQRAKEMMERHASTIRKGVFKEMSKSKINRVAGLLAIAGYFAVVYGQILRTEADLEEPGRYDWWP